ncbi:proline-rich proteoglycan 2-like [Homarus americanus]|uniref:proline-rich proteoglycan 2-like n=1 Tax=Homarus americanus TaxID=6706 RepID=UPI001C44ACFE|nr:proline-rich proteoglycan 2-like [Homarus americanus]
MCKKTAPRYPTVTVPPGTLPFALPSVMPPRAHLGVSALPGAPRGPPNGGGVPMGSPRDGCAHRDPPRGPPRGSGVPRGIFMVPYSYNAPWDPPICITKYDATRGSPRSVDAARRP